MSEQTTICLWCVVDLGQDLHGVTSSAVIASADNMPTDRRSIQERLRAKVRYMDMWLDRVAEVGGFARTKTEIIEADLARDALAAIDRLERERDEWRNTRTYAEDMRQHAAEWERQRDAALAELARARDLLEDWMNEHGGSGPTIRLLDGTRRFLDETTGEKP